MRAFRALAAGLWISSGLVAFGGPTADCNGNGVPDAQEVVPQFTTVAIDASADGAVSVAVGDVDGDEDLDVLAASEDDDTLAWYENLGGRSFGPQRTINAAADGPSRVLAGDLDGDGDLDVIATLRHWPTFALWHENQDGAGNFGIPKPIEVNTQALFGASGLLLGDIDADGDLDAVTGSGVRDRIQWHANAGGSGTFTPKSLVFGFDTPRTGLLTEISGDVYPDLVAAAQATGFVFAFQNPGGPGGFQLVETLDSGLHVPRAVRGADLDGDQDVDALVAWYGSGSITWYARSGGGFGPRQLVSSAIPGAQAAIGVDLDGDGDQDVAVAAATGSTGPGPGSTCCQAQGGTVCSDVECVESICASVDGFCCEVQWDSVCAQEALVDPDCSVACGGGLGRVAWFENLNGQGSFGPAKLIAASNGAWDVVAADLDGDGNQDLVTASYVADRVQVHWNEIRDCNGNDVPDDCDIAAGTEQDVDCDGVADTCDPDGGGGEDCNGSSVPDACEVDAGAVTDCTGNGIPDTCEADCDGDSIADGCEIAAGAPDVDGNGVPDGCDPDCNRNGTPDGLDTGTGSSADCDGDRVPDECQTDCDGNGVADTCDTSISFSNHVIASGFSGQLVWDDLDVMAADLDQDGDQDVVAAFGPDDLLVVYWNADGTGLVWEPETVSAAIDTPQRLAVADVNGDGKPDILAVTLLEHTLYWYEREAAQAAWTTHIVSVGANVNLTVLDVDGDGDVDVVSNIRLFRNVDSGGTQWREENLPYPSQDVDAADLDGDGDVDLAYGLGDFSGWQENTDGAGTFVAHVLTPPTTEEGDTHMLAGDLDGDGDADLVIGGGDYVAWYENLTGAGDFGYPRILAASLANVGSLSASDLDGDGDLDVLYTSKSSTFFAPHVKWVENLGGGLWGPATAFPGVAPWYDSVVSAADLDGDGDQDGLAVADIGATTSLFWFENGGDDCNGNAAPDTCEPDCDADGLIDVCALSSGAEVDCNGNAAPDSCDVSCPGACDGDADRCVDPLDAAPANPAACADTDGDGCDDCTSGTFAPIADGPDADGDGYCQVGDCADADPALWSEPSAARSLWLAVGTPGTQLGWSAPEAPGGSVPSYDVLRSPSGASFSGGAVCIESDGLDLTALDGGAPPAPGEAFYYLVRTQSGCPGSAGNLGADSSGAPRSGVACP